MKRRQFLETSSKLACGFTGAVSFLSLGPMQAVAATDETEPGPNIIGPRPPFSPQIGTLISTRLRRNGRRGPLGDAARTEIKGNKVGHYLDQSQFFDRLSSTQTVVTVA
jgi:hypothetical protein